MLTETVLQRFSYKRFNDEGDGQGSTCEELVAMVRNCRRMSRSWFYAAASYKIGSVEGAYMSEENLEKDMKRLRADRKKLIDTLQTLLERGAYFPRTRNKMEDASEAMTRLRKVVLDSQAILNEMKSSK